MRLSDLLLLDSNAIIALFGGDKGVAKLMATAQRIAIPAVVCGEIDSGTQGNLRCQATEKRAN